MKGWHLLVLIACVCGAMMLVYIHIIPVITAGPAYLIAEPRDPHESGSGQVCHLSRQDFTDHPVLSELILHKKRVMRAGSTANFLLGFFGGPAYSWMPLSMDEEQELLTHYVSTLEFNRSYYRITISP